MFTNPPSNLLSSFGSSRRELLSGAGYLLARWGLPPGSIAGLASAQQGKSPRGIYEAIGVRPLINARGTVTIVGATRTLPEVKKAMEEASRQYVHIDELMDSVGRRLAELTGAEWGAVTAGASAALTVATAACITGGDPDKLVQIPDLTGMQDEVIMPSYSRTAYDAAVRAVGARVIEVGTREEMQAAIGPRTAMIMVLAGGSSALGPLSLPAIVSLTKPRGIPVLVDAAAEELVVPNPHLTQGADLVAYSGGKCLRGPQCAGLLLGRKSLVQAAWIHSAPHHGFGRGMKVGREEIMGMLAAVEMWRKRNHAEEQRVWTSWLNHIARRLENIPGVTTRIAQPQSLSNRTPTLRVTWDSSRIPLTGYDVDRLLWDGEPRIAVSGAESFLPFPPNSEPNISIIPYQLEAGEEKVIAERVAAILSKPPQQQRNTAEPATNISGQWDVDMKFPHGSASHRFVLEQKGSTLTGTHFGSFAARDLAGSLHGQDILVRSSYTKRGVRLNFEYSGVVQVDSMRGKVSLGEYGTAEWEARRHSYGPLR